MGYYMAGGAFTVDAKGSGGSTFHDTGFIDDGPRRRRSLNKWNGRALGRAMRRVKAFEKMARKAVHFTHTVKFKKHRRG